MSENILWTYIAAFSLVRIPEVFFLLWANQLGLRAFSSSEPLAHSPCFEQIERDLRWFLNSELQSPCSDQTESQRLSADIALVSHWNRIAFQLCFHLSAWIHIDVHRLALIPYRSAHESVRVDSSRFVSIRFACCRIIFAMTSNRIRKGFASTSPQIVYTRLGVGSIRIDSMSLPLRSISPLRRHYIASHRFHIDCCRYVCQRLGIVLLFLSVIYANDLHLSFGACAGLISYNVDAKMRPIMNRTWSAHWGQQKTQ